MFRFLSASLLSVSLLTSALPASAQMPAAQPTPSLTLPQDLEQVQLTEESAKQAIDAYLALHEEYGAMEAPATDTGAIVQGWTTMEDAKDLLAEYGFTGFGEWQRTIMSFVLARNLLKDGSLEEYDASVEKLTGNENMSPELQQKIAEMMNRYRPSQHNLGVAKAIAADPAYADKLDKLN